MTRLNMDPAAAQQVASREFVRLWQRAILQLDPKRDARDHITRVHDARVIIQYYFERGFVQDLRVSAPVSGRHEQP